MNIRLKSLARLIDKGEEYGIPVLTVTAVGKEMARDSKYLSLACRILVSTGATSLKTYYCEESKKCLGLPAL